MRTVTWDDLLRPGHATRYFVRDPVPCFDAAARGYCAANAWWLAELSRIVYRGNVAAPLRSDLLSSAGFEELERFTSPATGTGAMLVRARLTPSFAVLAFRGTEQKIQDFLHDADTWPVPAFGGSVLVHRGFKRALNSVWTQIERSLDRIDVPVFYTGHSLGGALAVLAAARRPAAAVYTFGAPRVGDTRFVQKLQEVPIHRIVYGADIVACVPPEAFGFRHAGEERRIGTQSSGMASEVMVGTAMLWSAFATPPRALADHAPIRYVEGL